MLHCFNEKGIDYRNLEPESPSQIGTLRGSKYPVVGGVLNGIRPTLEEKHLKYCVCMAWRIVKRFLMT